MKLKHILLIITGAILVLFNFNCAEAEPEGSPIFSNVIQMRASAPSSRSITFSDVPPEAVTLIVGIFDAPISVDANNVITNPANFIYGIRTGLVGISSSGAYQYYNYNDGTKDFDLGTVGPTAPAGPYYWAVWGYNSSNVLICSTQLYSHTW